MALLWPRVRVEQIDAFQRRIGQPRKHIKRVTHLEAHIGQALFVNMPKRADYAVEERLTANEAVIGAHRGLPSQMFTRAKADFKFKRAGVPEQPLRSKRAIRHRNLWQQLINQRRLPNPQLMPRTPAIQAVDCGWITHV